MVDRPRAYETPAVGAWLGELVRRCEGKGRAEWTGCRGVDWSAGRRVARFDAHGSRFALQWARGPERDGLARTDRFVIRLHRGDEVAARPAARVFARILDSLGDSPESLFDEPPPRPLGPGVDDVELGAEAGALRPILDRWRRLVGPVGVHALDGPGGGFALVFPPLPDDLDPGGRTRFQPLPGFLRASPHRGVWEALGFRADRDGVLRTVPTPHTIIRRAEAWGEPLAFRPELVPLDRDVVPPERWVRAVAAGVVPIHVPGQGSLSRGVDRALAGPFRRLDRARSALASRLAALPHDLGKHVLLPRRVPIPQRDALAARLPERASAQVWSRWTEFFENELPRACEELYRSCDEPEEFDARAGGLPSGPDDQPT